MLVVQAQEQKQKQKVKLSQILKTATEEQSFGYFMKISEITDLDEDDHHHHHQITSSSTRKSMVKVCVNGLLMSKAGIGDESSSTILSVYEYVADDDEYVESKVLD
jgi:hypothetical protein